MRSVGNQAPANPSPESAWALLNEPMLVFGMKVVEALRCWEEDRMASGVILPIR
jgi:hypothetical protein